MDHYHVMNKVLYMVYLVTIVNKSFAVEEICNRRPLGTKTKPLAADSLFALDLGDLDDKYIPNKSYKVRLHSTDEKTKFIAFTIFATGDTKENDKNPRRPIPLEPGRIMSNPDPTKIETVTRDECLNTLFEFDTTPKTSVTVIWQAPPKENKCVTIHASVAITHDVWYNAEGPLLKRVCEDRRKAEDMPPKENDNCQVCEDARFELAFEGAWSYNTHPSLFPVSRELARFSDIVGAAHSNNFALFRLNSDASEGLKMLAEQGNTTTLEEKILEELGTNVRTLIKGTGPPKPNMTTVMSFRANREMHLVSLVTAMIPSPDWFLGVANLELCEIGTNRWANSIVLNLYPYDAGTDSGLNFEAPNEATSPPKPISLADIDKNILKENIKPFAKLRVRLMRTYSNATCKPVLEETGETDGNGDENTEEPDFPSSSEPYITRGFHSSTTEEPPPPDPSSNKDCPMTGWEYLSCEGACVDGRREGYRAKMRYFIVDGRELGRNFDSKADSADIPEFCVRNYPTSEIEECEEQCEEESDEETESEAQRRVWTQPVRPGTTNWNGRK